MPADVQSLSLPDGIKLRPIVPADDLPPWIVHIAGFLHVMLSATIGFCLKSQGIVTDRLREPHQGFIGKCSNLIGGIFICPALYVQTHIVESSPARILGRIFSCHERFPRLGKQRCQSVVAELILLIVRVERIVDLHYISLTRHKLLLQESRQVHFADETYSLRVFLVCRRQVGFARQTPDLRLRQASYREKRSRKLFLAELAEEIALILVRINSFEQPGLWDAVNDDRPARSIQQWSLAAIVSRRNHVSTHFASSLPESIELDFPVAKHVRVRSASGVIFIEHILHHLCPVFLGKVHEIERNADFPCHQLCHVSILLPFAVPVQSGVRIVPVLHEHGEYVVPLLLQQQGSNAGVHAS